MMEITVIIPTYNGKDKIVKALDSLLLQTYKTFKINIVIDGSTDNTYEVISNKKYDLDINIIVQVNGGRSVAKNNGAQKANDGLLIFLDDDMIPCNTFVEEHVKHHLHYPNSILTGAYENHPDLIKTDMGQYGKYLHKKWTKGLNEISVDEKMNKTNYFIQSGNCSMNKYTFNVIGQFDKRLNDAEDYYLSVLANRKNIDMYYSKTAWAYHYELRSCIKYIKRIREYHISQLVLKTLDDEIAKNSKYVISNVSKSKMLIYKTFASLIWINLIDKGFLKFMPQYIRFKLYDVIITSNGVYYPLIVKL